jgi:hypothetical protein
VIVVRINRLVLFDDLEWGILMKAMTATRKLAERKRTSLLDLFQAYFDHFVLQKKSRKEKKLIVEKTLSWKPSSKNSGRARYIVWKFRFFARRRPAREFVISGRVAQLLFSSQNIENATTVLTVKCNQQCCFGFVATEDSCFQSIGAYP